ncbi:hypothetical protein [uncultured Thiodictyon sp.]|uniref:hypothetical protein n=1 Tax=uncultured Thiodictyon sp. TaxID=1846217 RepID=UPI0025EE1F7E|nr:hypothetical protein [uncultured Thiodictyon sp.]
MTEPAAAYNPLTPAAPPGTLMPIAAYSGPFSSPASFGESMKMARALCSSDLVPKAYRGDAGLGSALIALDMAARIGVNPLMVMQNLYIVEGRPSWSAQFLIGTINACGRFSALRYDLSEPGPVQTINAIVGYHWDNSKGDRGRKIADRAAVSYRPQTCRAWTHDLRTGEKLIGPEVSTDMAVSEGWLGKSGSKWQTMPELMLRYRAASFWVRTYAPEISMGMVTAEESQEIAAGPLEVEVTSNTGPGSSASNFVPMSAALSGPTDQKAPVPEQAAAQEIIGEWPKLSPALGVLVDVQGCPWIEEVHSTGQICNDDGFWRRKRGVMPATAREAEAALLAKLQGESPAPTTQPAQPAQAAQAEPDKAEQTTEAFTLAQQTEADARFATYQRVLLNAQDFAAAKSLMRDIADDGDLSEQQRDALMNLCADIMADLENAESHQ